MRVAIVGGGPSQSDTPWGDPDLQVWGLGTHWPFLQRVDRIFEIHANWREFHDPARLARAGVPVVMQKRHEDIPLSTAFPATAIRVRWAMPTPPLGSTLDYMLADAVFRGAREIRLYGFEMADGTEYEDQRPTAHYWLGVARGAGVRVWIHPDSALLRAGHPYGSIEHARGVAA